MRSEIVKILKEGGVGVLATDTLYGVVGSALNKKTVERIFKIRRRNPKKPCIVLIASIGDLAKFGITLSREAQGILRKVWPGKVSVLLPCEKKQCTYLHRGTGAIAFRVPAKDELRKLLKNTGPLVAPSANLEGFPPAKNIREARRYFGDEVDFYGEVGSRATKPSTLIAIRNGKIEVLREGAVDIHALMNK